MRPLAVAAAVGLTAALGCAWGEVREPEPQARAAPVEGAMCVEHGVLEAVCTQCNPALIPVFQAKGDWCAEHRFPMSFCPIHHPEAGGRPAADIRTDDGPPDGLKIRFKTRETARLAGLGVAVAEVAPDRGGVEAVARITWDGTKVALVSGRGPGVVQAVRADVGTQVAAGDALAIVGSATASADRAGYDAAASQLAFAEQDLARKRGLKGVVSDAEIRAAEQVVAGARAAAAGARTHQGYTLTTPLPGVVVARVVTVGMAVDAGTPMFEVVDPSALWAELDVHEAELSLLRAGQAVTVSVDGVADRAWTGTISYIAPVIDPDTRTGLARVALDNTDGALRANMYGRARIAVGGDRDIVAVPGAAVQRAGGVDVVFVKLAEDTYETRRVAVVGRQGDRVYLAAGVRSGEVVVTEGSFLLKTETSKDSIGAGCCDVE